MAELSRFSQESDSAQIQEKDIKTVRDQILSPIY